MLGVCRTLCGNHADGRPVKVLSVERVLFNEGERGCEIGLCRWKHIQFASEATDERKYSMPRVINGNGPMACHSAAPHR
jgi:hypothetical protein